MQDLEVGLRLQPHSYHGFLVILHARQAWGSAPSRYFQQWDIPSN
jgi:hypothetical protein